MYCSKCGTMLSEGAAFCSTCGQSVTGASTASPSAPAIAAPARPQQSAAGPAAGAPGVLYAGFWLRVVAAIIDGLILTVPFAAIFLLLMASALPSLIHANEQEPLTIVMTILPRLLLLGVIYLAGSWLYWSLMESSEWQATLGKKALGVYVTDLAGNRATFGRTSGRFFAGRGIGMIPYLGGLYFLISCILAGFSEKKQALHDMIANCLVMRKA